MPWGFETPWTCPVGSPTPIPICGGRAWWSSSSVWDALPTVLIEALALGTPVVSTECGAGPREILDGGRYGPLVPTQDPQALAAALARTLADPLPRETLLQGGQRYEVDRNANLYLRLMLGPGPSGALVEVRRVALMVSDFEDGGVERNFTHLASGLARLGVQTWLLAGRARHPYLEDLDASVSVIPIERRPGTRSLRDFLTREHRICSSPASSRTTLRRCAPIRSGGRLAGADPARGGRRHPALGPAAAASAGICSRPGGRSVASAPVTSGSMASPPSPPGWRRICAGSSVSRGCPSGSSTTPSSPRATGTGAGLLPPSLAGRGDPRVSLGGAPSRHPGDRRAAQGEGLSRPCCGPSPGSRTRKRGS